jgi:hypothetical protein
MRARQLDGFDPIARVGAHVEARVFEDETQVRANDRVVFYR